MTKKLYLQNSYLKEFEATVTKVENKFIVLDKTVFYPLGGGQLNDEGKLICNDEEYKVVFVKKIGEDISHEVDKEGLKQGDKVKGIINWDRRYTLMRCHTAAHVISAIFHKEANALITGNQLSLDKVRIDFNLENFDREKINDYFEKANSIVEKDLLIKTYFVSREEAEKDSSLFKLAKALPETIKEIRIVEIVDFDKQADAGTHVKSLKEVWKIEFLKAENKGKNNRRVYFKLK